MDKQTKLEIMQVVNDAVRRALEGAEERWLTRDQLIEHFGMLNAEWVRRYGKFLCPASAIVITKDGRTTITREAYPLHKINRMIQENRLCFDVAKENECIYKPSKK